MHICTALVIGVGCGKMSNAGLGRYFWHPTVSLNFTPHPPHDALNFRHLLQQSSTIVSLSLSLSSTNPLAIDKMSRKQSKSERANFNIELIKDIESYLNAPTVTQPDGSLLRQCLEFLQDEPTALDRDALSRYLDPAAKPKREAVTSILPLDELHERLELIENIEAKNKKDMPDWELTSVYFAALLVAPLGYLRDLSKNSKSRMSAQEQVLLPVVQMCMLAYRPVLIFTVLF